MFHSSRLNRKRVVGRTYLQKKIAERFPKWGCQVGQEKNEGMKSYETPLTMFKLSPTRVGA